MVLKRRVDCRLTGYHFPSFPSVPISAKGKRSVRKRNVEDRMYAFDLLAAVADKLFERKNSPPTYDILGSSIYDSKQGILNENKSCDNEFPNKEHSDNTLELSGTSFISLCSSSSNNATEEQGSSVSGKVGVSKNEAVNGKTTLSLECQGYKTGIGGNPSGCYIINDPVTSDIVPLLMRSERSPEVHVSRDNDPYNSSSPHSSDGLELIVHRDDDENSFRCSHPCTSTNKATKPYLGEHRLRNLLASRCCKVDLYAAKPAELSKTAEADMKPAFPRRKIICTNQRTPRRKLFKRYSVSASHSRFSNADVLNLLKKKEILQGSRSHGVNGITSTITEQLSSYKPEDFHVKLSIKSFIVPELFIEIPETATVGSLKGIVMEAITAIIDRGLHVGVLLQGKNFKDDDRTLIQAGISNANELDELSFTLEPNSSLPSQRYSNSGNPHLFLPCESTKALSRLPAETSLGQGTSDSTSYPALLSTIVSHESDHGSVLSALTKPSLGGTSYQSLAPSSVLSVEFPSVAQVNNTRTSELVQRRIRRPFAVSEVEALVQAVEKFGTGRWRDVKLQSFDDAKHRTYVDLKDKWKTLVHTARISPRQRRGEPVPQELLDRVLLAHAYWSQQQAKPSSTESSPGTLI